MKSPTVNLGIEQHRKLKVHCATTGVPMTDYVKEAIDEKMERAKNE